ncbi:MAG: hypothetical protein LBT47_11435, partial [Deltaproteobacteria bacterium]|nr:hypothetical protein [Deltaproteobacteria bacterium]
RGVPPGQAWHPSSPPKAAAHLYDKIAGPKNTTNPKSHNTNRKILMENSPMENHQMVNPVEAIGLDQHLLPRTAMVRAVVVKLR